ncbi:MAG: class B sortase [Faecalicatena sp.]|uniref:class B sortase n=1 Tax=Faecalicatena sp. TaxID=2005360 RepID=UPI0025905DB9|nr:class B sortase [Faecalicatena sp.]MCI6465603.1 class B sortase [Faecalicatena sp.]MDY5617435.1 class B sortase [Lachnospiraceae bacterium]
MSRKKRQADGHDKKKKSSGGLLTAVLLIAICVFIFSAYQLIMMLIPYYSGGKEYDKVKKLAITNEKKDPKDTKDGKNGEDDGFRVDFNALLKENPDTVAWLRFDEPSVISYPVVKSTDNQEYLTKTFSANDNKLGAIFMDMRNNSEFTDLNTFIYGHNLKVGGEMFSQLNEYASEEFCKKHPYFYIYTPKGKLTYQVFSASTVKDNADNYNLAYATTEDYVNYLQLCRDSSNYQVDVKLNEKSQIVSLSTCTNINDDERFLVQGVLVKSE